MHLGDLTVYHDGRFTRYDDAKIGLLTHGLQYGTGCFEGVRGFWNAHEEELYLLELAPHYDRLAQSARILLMQLPHTTAELIDISIELCVRNAFRGDVYLRPFSYKANEDIGVRLHDVRDAFAIVAIPFDRYFDTARGLRCGVSSWRRMDDTMAPARGKITGIYVNSALAKSEAIMNGLDEAIMLSAEGHVSEGSAENLFIVRRGMLHTPDASQNILEGVTRRAVMTLAREELGIETVERPIDRSELFIADECFITGSAAGIQWIESIDHRQVGDGQRGPISAALIDLYDRAVRGNVPKYAHWLTPAYAQRKAAAR
ncbi:branched chain amino acid aminotransferase [Vulcanimicrobium alpinum]|uniref:Branched-chain-amino-acid aminotransferase n=1 Tax=Vulcanimicrobium alpinum TaxID=3016050 RepID=A0AAN1XTC9_UNVUL|nr:branched-chain amino acid transaminase [Vulcanimicrobium alpinum]BDE04869.1 branched chain amino acid aminotransferase [Vulcanimicrobium alpinum]